MTQSTIITADIPSADIIRLIQHHLTECGLHISCRTLSEESGVGATATHSNLKSLCESGRWGEVQEVIGRLDARCISLSASLMARIHEMTILELAELGEMDLARATLRLAHDELEAERLSSSSSNTCGWSNLKSSIEHRITSLGRMRKSASSTTVSLHELPTDYYGENGKGKQQSRNEIGKDLSEVVPLAPRARLVSLIQQAMKWQSHTGQLPMVEDKSHHSDDSDDDDDDDDKKKKKKRKRKKRKKVIVDIVLGEIIPRKGANQESSTTGTTKGGSSTNHHQIQPEKIPSRELTTIKFGKKSHPESALFLPDGLGLITGSSDGFIEIWDTTHKSYKLRTHDLPYQKNEELLQHENESPILSLAYSYDGTMLASGDATGMVKVWKIGSGTCLRKFERAHNKAVSCIAFRRDGSHVLTCSMDGSCREFGLRASRMLKEFRGHSSYVNTCHYLMEDQHAVVPNESSTAAKHHNLKVLTSSADGTCIVWDASTEAVLHKIQPGSMDDNTALPPTVTTTTHLTPDHEGGGKNIHSVLLLHTPPETLLIVPRGPNAYLVRYNGTVLRSYQHTEATIATTGGKSTTADFVAATVSPSNKWLYCVNENGLCVCFSVASGEVESTLDVTSEGNNPDQPSGGGGGEITGLQHHPHEGILASFSNFKGVKRGLLKLWK